MRITKKQRSLAAAVGAIIVLGLTFQNMTLMEFSLLGIGDVDDGIRQEQARELLGEYYRGSFAQKFEGTQYLSYLIYKKVDTAMGDKYRTYTPELVRTIIQESKKYEFDPVFILAVIQTESNFNPRAKGTSGEIGLMQVLPRTAEWIAKKYHKPWHGDDSLYDPVTNIKLGVLYFAHLRTEFDGTAYHYLPAYNMGSKNLRRIQRTMGSVGQNGKVKKREYAVRVMKNYTIIYREMADQQIELTKDKKMAKIAGEDLFR